LPLYSVTFTDDGYMLYNDNADPYTGRGERWIARTDGTLPRRIRADVPLGVTLAEGACSTRRPIRGSQPQRPRCSSSTQSSEPPRFPVFGALEESRRAVSRARWPKHENLAV